MAHSFCCATLFVVELQLLEWLGHLGDGDEAGGHGRAAAIEELESLGVACLRLAAGSVLFAVTWIKT